MKWLTLLFSLACCSVAGNTIVTTSRVSDTPLVVRNCIDFVIIGKGDNPEWQKTK
jgi:hypothetical protein